MFLAVKDKIVFSTSTQFPLLHFIKTASINSIIANKGKKARAGMNSYPCSIHRTFSIEMINPNTLPTWIM